MGKPATLAFVLLIGTAGAALAADGDPAAGEDVFRKCRSCHEVGPEAKTRLGPVLNNLFGRKAGTIEGFKYSASNLEKGAAGLVWTEETLFKYLEDPRSYIPGTTMAFAGLADEQDRRDVIAYLKQFNKK